MEKKIDADINCYQLGIQDIVQDYFKKPRKRNSGHPELIVNLQNHLEKCVKMDRQFTKQKVFDDIERHNLIKDSCSNIIYPQLKSRHLSSSNEGMSNSDFKENQKDSPKTCPECIGEKTGWSIEKQQYILCPICGGSGKSS